MIDGSGPQNWPTFVGLMCISLGYKKVVNVINHGLQKYVKGETGRKKTNSINTWRTGQRNREDKVGDELPRGIITTFRVHSTSQEELT